MWLIFIFILFSNTHLLQLAIPVGYFLLHIWHFFYTNRCSRAIFASHKDSEAKVCGKAQVRDEFSEIFQAPTQRCQRWLQQFSPGWWVRIFILQPVQPRVWDCRHPLGSDGRPRLKLTPMLTHLGWCHTLVTGSLSGMSNTHLFPVYSPQWHG